MFWVIQNNIFSENNYHALLDALGKMGVPHTVVKVVPFSDALVSAEFDSHAHSGTEEADIDESGLVMVSGSLSLARIAKNRGWLPGSFLNENFSYEKWREAYGEHLLNFESLTGSFGKIAPPWEQFFIRPCEDTKDFDGMVFDKKEFEAWRNGLLGSPSGCPFESSAVVASPATHIAAEYRFFVVDGKIAAQSRYKLNFKVGASSEVPEGAISFAQRMADAWQPARAFVIDIALTEKGFKVIEINNINSAGFYACDVQKFVEAIERMKF